MLHAFRKRKATKSGVILLIGGYNFSSTDIFAHRRISAAPAASPPIAPPQPTSKTQLTAFLPPKPMLHAFRKRKATKSGVILLIGGYNFSSTDIFAHRRISAAQAASLPITSPHPTSKNQQPLSANPNPYCMLFASEKRQNLPSFCSSRIYLLIGGYVFSSAELLYRSNFSYRRADFKFARLNPDALLP